MAERIDIAGFLEKANVMPIVDVRSPKEFKAGRLPLATSIPLFENDERAVVGTLYKQEGRRAAIKEGLDIVGPKLKSIVEEVEKLNAETIGVYCWRGGMRSDSVAWLLERYGFNVTILDGGYKAYRQAMISFFQKELPLYIISGSTGSKKTALLHRIAHYGGQIIDLEGLAQHQGSSFGNQKSISQPSSEQFQNLTYDSFRKLDLTRPIFVEDECQRIGQVALTDTLFAQMKKSVHVLVDVAKEERVNFLLEDYGTLDAEQLISATEAIARKLGRENAKTAIEAIEVGDLRTAVDIILIYYDKRYQVSREKKEDQFKFRYKMKMAEIDILAQELSNYVL